MIPYKAESRVWNTLTASKMEVFVTTGICKVIFCRLIILCTQYSPVSVFFVCYVVTASILLRLVTCMKISEMVLFVVKAVANVKFFGAMVLQAQFHPKIILFLCQFVAEFISFQLVPFRSKWF